MITHAQKQKLEDRLNQLPGWGVYCLTTTEAGILKFRFYYMQHSDMIPEDAHHTSEELAKIGDRKFRMACSPIMGNFDEGVKWLKANRKIVEVNGPWDFST